MKNIFLINKIYVITLFSLLFVSCLEIDTTIDIKKDNSGTWILQYRIMQEASYITPGSELSGYNYFPLNETDIKDRINSIPGLDLLSVSTLRTLAYNQYTIEMNFNNTGNIESFFNNFTDINLVNISLEDNGYFKLTLKKPVLGDIDPDTLGIMNALYKDSTIKVTIILPGIVTESNKGLLSDNPSEAALNIKTLDTLQFTEPFEWIVTYDERMGAYSTKNI